jgi:HAD superfamily hydrolase (TIGR01549 family)
MTSTIFFDVGGTLVDSLDLFEVVARRLCDDKVDKKAYDLVFSTFMRIYENREKQRPFLKVEDMLAQTLTSLSMTHGYKNISEQSHNLVWEVYLHRSTLYPEVGDLLKILFENKVRMIIASDADSELMDQELDKFNIARYFCDQCVSESVKAYKPASGFIHYLRKYTAGNEEHCFFVGDNRVDIESAKRLKIRSVLIDRKRSGNRFNADFTVQNLEELLPILGLPSG